MGTQSTWGNISSFIHCNIGSAYIFNALELQFFDTYPYPSWFLYMSKASYIQIMLFAALTLKSVAFDPEFKFCVLIRESKSRDIRKESHGIELSEVPRDLMPGLTGASRLFYNETNTVDSRVELHRLHVPQDSLTEF